MPNLYDEKYFLNSQPFICGNSLLREPQIEGYLHAFEHFVVKEKDTHAIIVLPTGVGKTGVIGILPYGICKGRMLIITPQITIKETVIDSLDPEKINNFWLKRGVFKSVRDLPTLIEYSPELPFAVLTAANIIVLNIQKLQKRLESSPLNNLPSNFFDMIIIDEAHHSTANTWVETTNHFDAKVVKLTGTPIRTDKVELAGELVYKYKLSQAMLNNYVKSLRNLNYIPDELYFTIDQDNSRKYTYNELLELDLKDEDWIRRSVAYSPECSQHVVDLSLKLLEERRSLSSIPHKIIAVACTIVHANQIKTLYDSKGYRAEVIYSTLESSVKTRIKKDIENHRIDVIVHVNMLGEGYDHPYLSIGAIFRPFRNTLPYEQFVGRILRSIPEEEIQNPIDNIADIVSHKYLELGELWEKYKIEIQESEIIKHLQEVNDIIDSSHESSGIERDGASFGSVTEIGNGYIDEDVYLNTELIRENNARKKDDALKIAELQKLLSISQEEARKILNQHQVQDSDAIKRPDLYFRTKSKDVDNEIRVNIVPTLITSFKINQKNNDLVDCGLFNGKYQWIPGRAPDNGGMLAIYFNTYLKHALGKAKKEWLSEDCVRALELLPEINEYVTNI
ncbi:MAG: DEAD/DEAH box helicase, partial [Mobilitalea sp.]